MPPKPAEKKPSSTAGKAPASSAGKAPASEAAKKTSKAPAKSGEKKKATKVRKETYSTYIYRVLKQVHPDTGISNKAMASEYPIRNVYSARFSLYLTTPSLLFSNSSQLVRSGHL